MKKTIIGLTTVIGTGFGVSAHAQSSVTMYGIIDDGVTYVNNVSGHSTYLMQSGISQGSRWGIQGTEDLGGGTSAVFRLENGFNNNTGTASQGGRMFGRAAYVGLSNTRYGALLLGRQNEMVGDYIGQYSANGNWGIMIPHPGDMDNNGIDYRINNAVRYNSPVIAGFRGSALYSLGGVAGQFNRDSVKSFGLNYANGGLGVAAAYTSIDHLAEATPEGVWVASNPINGNYGLAAGRYQVFGAAAQYAFGKAKVSFTFTNTKFLNLNPAVGALIDGHVSFNIYEAVASYMVTPALQVGGAYMYTDGKVSATGQSPRYHTAGLIADYFFSKRTDVYLQSTYMRAAGDAKVAALQPTIGASSTESQIAVRIGIRHKF